MRTTNMSSSSSDSHTFLSSSSHYKSLLLLLFLCLCSVLLGVSSLTTADTTTTTLSDDLNTLLLFKSSLPNPDILSDWTPSSPNPCLFTGVTCSNSDSTRITAVDLTSIQLSTSFPTHLLSLSALQSLTLTYTNISGLLSPPLQTCPPSLTDIDLSHNSLTASLPQLTSFFSPCPFLSSLNLSSNSIISGPINTLITPLPTLQKLDLSTNQLTSQSTLQHILTSTPNLTYLSLTHNSLSGELSFKNCGGLHYLDISSNNFDGVIHDQFFTGCTSLRYLNISNNEFTGPIPDLPTTNLQFLYCQSNHFQGDLHHTLLPDICPSLIELDLSSNNLTGTIPSTFNLCSSLQILDLSHNNLTGNFPSETLLQMTSLKKLNLAFNYFTGTLPLTLSSLTTHLTILDLSANRITGQLPSSICTTTTTTLTELYLSDNSLTGPIPPTIGKCTQLISLDLSFNHLTGPIPTTLGSLTKLKDLIMWMNNLVGTIPSTLTNIKSLENLILDYNQLTGTIPHTLRNCKNLNWISLSNNLLTGEIPYWIGELLSLSILKLSNNSFHGSIPPEIGDCRSLLWIDLNSNSLTGTIPSTLSNQSGKLAVGLVVGKKYVYLRNDGSNKECHGAGDLFEFSGIRDQTGLNEIPSRKTCNFTRIYRGNTLPTFQHNGTVMFLDLSYNLLQGVIPKEFGSMYDLQILNLAHNQLSGEIPMEISGMKSVGVMDLSYNRLSGEIPKSLVELTLLTEIDLSNNDLSGMIPDSGQFDSFPAERFANNSGLCGYPLIDCKKKHGTENGSGEYRRHRKWRQGMVAGFVGFGLLLVLLSVSVFMLVFVKKVKRRRGRHEEMTGFDGKGGNSNSGSTNTGWKLTGAREAMSINLATFDKPLRKLTFADLVEATNGFHHDCLVGSGGFGDVYMARLKDGSIVAIKKLIHVSVQGEKEFMAEMETIGRIKHRNLVPLFGYCKVGEERLLVYEYMKYGSLDEVLRNPKKSGLMSPLNWEKRRKIAIGAARGLAFLHHNCTPHVIHRDMKSSNVLLDDDLEAKVSDFGMARLVGVMDTHLSVSSLAGTPGYVPPEYYQSFQCSTKGDVYSYGVVLLELLTGKKPTNSIDFGEDNLVGWVKRHAKMKISDVFDPVLMKEDPKLEVELLQHLKVACACLNDRPWKRPTMIEVMAMFKEIRTGSIVEGIDGIEGSFRNVDGRRGAAAADMSMEEIPEGSNL